MSLEENNNLMQFKALLREAMVLYESDRLRDSADTAIEAVTKAPSVWTENRYVAFNLFLYGIDGSMTKNDANLLKRFFLYNQGEPVICRAQAANILGMAKMRTRSVHEAASFFRQGLEYLSQSPPEHDTRVIVFPPYDNDPEFTMVQQFRKLKLALEANLGVVEGKTFSESEVQILNNEVDRVRAQEPLCRSTEAEEDLRKRFMAGGKHCDVCNKSEEESGLEKLSKCSRCKLAFYCSTGCQRKAWNSGHKQACRKKGQVEIGDDMVLDGLTNRPELNGRFVKVVRESKSEGRWLVRLSGESSPISVSGDKLLRLCPEF